MLFLETLFGRPMTPGRYNLGHGSHRTSKRDIFGPFFFWPKRERLSGVGSILGFKLGELTKTCKRGVYRPPRFSGNSKSPTGS